MKFAKDFPPSTLHAENCNPEAEADTGSADTQHWSRGFNTGKAHVQDWLHGSPSALYPNPTTEQPSQDHEQPRPRGRRRPPSHRHTTDRRERPLPPGPGSAAWRWGHPSGSPERRPLHGLLPHSPPPLPPPPLPRGTRRNQPSGEATRRREGPRSRAPRPLLSMATAGAASAARAQTPRLPLPLWEPRMRTGSAVADRAGPGRGPDSAARSRRG